MTRPYHPWTPQEDALILALSATHDKYGLAAALRRQCAVEPPRTVPAVGNRMYRLGVRRSALTTAEAA